MFDYLLESSHIDDSNKWSNIRFGEEIIEVVSMKVHITPVIWRCGTDHKFFLFGDEAVLHDGEVAHEFGGAVRLGVDVEAATL